MSALLDRRAFLAGLAGFAATVGTAHAQRRGRWRGRGRGGDHERALQALREGEVRPLTDILDEVHDTVAGEVIEVELEREDGRYVYELKILTPSGRLVEVQVDAATGAVLEIEDD